jgi:hypothetical protein
MLKRSLATAAHAAALTGAAGNANAGKQREIKRILGMAPRMGQALGVDEKWAHNIVKRAGNYGDSFERNVCMGAKLRISRGLNQLWTRGGIQYARRSASSPATIATAA